MTRRVLAAALVALAMVACNGKKKPPTAPAPASDDAGAPTGAGDAAACDAQRAKVESLYRAHAGAPPAAPDERARYDESVGDNVHMILTDCRTDPARFAPCIESATSVAYLETSCVIPLDEAGTVEGTRFGDEDR